MQRPEAASTMVVFVESKNQVCEAALAAEQKASESCGLVCASVAPVSASSASVRRTLALG